MTAYELAQVNIARLKAPLDTPLLKDFVDNLDPVNADADAAAGFVWRLQSDDGDATAIPVFDDPWLIVNLSVWRDTDALTAFMYQGRHREMLGRRREWFERVEEAMTALWWVPAGHRPAVAEAEARLSHLRTHGPTPYAFTLRTSFPPGTDGLAPAGPVGDKSRAGD
ncbi:DUF3291 domain-containing protein [Streptomyces lusitanus]|uniref:DUF3291 domain-containing protein n=1 Tax=Streptomyces lusitanus TaxID=68232 RepID=A0ABU3JRX1_9ACTN|nr:DUF3291 domain-containing protein [Streptomyces lusitanus]